MDKIALIRAEIEMSDNLEEAAKEFYPDFSNSIASKAAVDSMRGAFKAGAEWQKKQDKETIELAEDHAYFAGGVNEREKMMAGAVDVHVVRSYNPITEEGKPTLHGVELLYKDETNSYLVAGEDARIIIIKNNNK